MPKRKGSEASLIFSHLTGDYTEPVRDPLWKHIGLSRGLKDCSQCPEVQLLAGIRQLGPASLVYPGATHTRLSHSFGVFYLGKRMIEELLRKDPSLGLSLSGVKAFLAATFLHDVGHFPFAHSLKELPLLPHETLSGEMIRSGNLARAIRDSVGTDPSIVAAIIDKGMPADDEEVRFYRNLLSGVLDPDKLDYLNRDAYFCGVPYGVQDTDFVISSLVPHPEGLGLEEKGITAVENILFSKYLMYRTVYWHRTVRSATAMIKKAVFSGLREGRLTPKDLYRKDDEGFFQRFERENFPCSGLVKAVAERRLHKLAWEESFDPEDKGHERLLDLETRRKSEEGLARLLSVKAGRTVEAEEIVIDIPEPISFEVDLPIRTGDGFRPFSDCGSVFGESVVDGFKRTLRTIRYFVSPRLSEILKQPDIFKDREWLESMN